MPTYLVHGFRWLRHSIRIHIILYNLEDAAPEWIIAPATSITILNSLYTLYDFLPPSNPPAPNYPPPPPIPQDEPIVPVPSLDENGEPKTFMRKKKSLASLKSLRRKNSKKDILASRPKTSGSTGNGSGHRQGEKSTSSTASRPTPFTTPSTSTTATTFTGKTSPFNVWSAVKLIEQYDPDDLESVSQPYAYVADYMVEVKLSAGITDEVEKYEARVKAEEGSLSISETSTCTESGNSIGLSSGGPNGTLSARDMRRKSRRLGWLEKLRDGLEKDSQIGWFVVVCGDEERLAPSVDESYELDDNYEDGEEWEPQITPRGGNFRGFFQRKKPILEE